MDGFRERMAYSARRRGPIILAADMPYDDDTIQNIQRTLDRLQNYICAVKMNFQVLLPLGIEQIRRITHHAADLGLQCIADIKLNDIGNTNAAASSILWDAGFDAIIANPMMGPSALSALAKSAHSLGHGIIFICHMSSPEGAVSYEMQVEGRPLHDKFLSWGLAAGADGMIVGATFPHIIAACKKEAKDAADIISPGVGTQGGDAREAFLQGADYIIVGRSLLGAENLNDAARSLLP